MLTKIYLDGYWQFSELGVPMTEIYELVMVKKLKCKVVLSGRGGMRRFVMPNGQPFYTFEQFRYRVIKEIGLDDIHKRLYGAARYRNRLAPSEGSYSESVANLMEDAEMDGYFTKEKPRGYLEGSTLPALNVVRCRDSLSGMLVGIGFALGAERSAAYRMALFCMAVPKPYFGELFGLKINVEDWPCQGLPANPVFDRGPGSIQKLIAEFETKFPIRDMTESWAGQSKATVESAHPRDLKIEGQPTHLGSTLTPVQLARKEIVRLIRDNHASDMEDRIEQVPEMAHLPPTRIAIWEYYDARFRNDAQPMSIDDAVRTFLTPKQFSLKEDGVYLGQRRFNSRELRATDVFKRLMRSPHCVQSIPGYVLDLCVRYVWVEIDSRLYRLEAELRIRGDENDLYVCLSELEQFEAARAEVRSEFRSHQRAVSAEWIQHFEESTGESWTSARRRSGKPKRNNIARQEERDAKEQGSSRRSK